MRLWKVIDGEPYMINDPRLGILGLNPKKSKSKGRVSMARRGHGARHMAWVRSFQKRRRKRNYVMAGPVFGANPRRRRRKANPSRRSRVRAAVTRGRGFLGLPPVMPIVYGSAGFVAVAGLQGVVTGFLPTEWVTDPATNTENKLTKYGVLAVSLIGTTWIAKSVFGAGPAALAGIGGGIYTVSQLVHDFLPGTVPGMSAYSGIGSYEQIRAYRQVRQYAPIGNGGGSLAAPDFGAVNSAGFAPNGAANIVQARFRRFQ